MSMRASLRARARGAVVLGAAAVALTGGLVVSGTAHAQAEADTFTVTSDAGDTIAGGNSYAYDFGAGDTFTVRAGTNDNAALITVKGANGDQWALSLQAPSGQPLTPGTYTGVTKYAVGFSPAQPALSFSSATKSCSTVTGSFTVNSVVFAPNSGVQAIDATFEQHCNGAAAASYGHIRISKPDPLTLTADVAADGTFSTLDGNATIHGTVTCTLPVNVTLTPSVTQVAHRTIIRGTAPVTTLACTPGTPVPWTATAVPSGTTPFQHGDVEAVLKATTSDPLYGEIVTTTQTVAVTLRKG